MVANPNLLAFISSIQIDKVINVITGTLHVNAPTSAQLTLENTSDTPTGINDYTFFYGIYSLDNGTTWNDFNSFIVEYDGSGNPIFNTCDVWGESRPNTFTVHARNWYRFATSSSVARDIIYKVAIIATGTQGVVTPQPTGQKLQFSSGFNYQKIFKDEVLPVTLAANERKTFPFPHNLGYVPRMRAWVMRAGVLYDFGHILTGDAYSPTSMDENNINFTISNENNASPYSLTLYVRTYYDA